MPAYWETRSTEFLRTHAQESVHRKAALFKFVFKLFHIYASLFSTKPFSGLITKQRKNDNDTLEGG